MEANEEATYLLTHPGVRDLVDRVALAIHERTSPSRLWNAMVDGQRIEGDPFMTDARTVAIAVVVELFANVTDVPVRNHGPVSHQGRSDPGPSQAAT